MHITSWQEKYQVPSRSFLLAKASKYEAFKGWYASSREAIVDIVGETDAPLFSDLLAVTSPRTSVGNNLRLARNTYNVVKAKRPLKWLPHYGIANKMIRANVTRVIDGMPISGPKVSAFSRALRGDEDAIVIDTWMMKAFNLPRKAPTKRDRECISLTIKSVAHSLNWTPAQVQAALWVYAKKELNDTRQRDVHDYSVYLKQRRLF